MIWYVALTSAGQQRPKIGRFESLSFLRRPSLISINNIRNTVSDKQAYETQPRDWLLRLSSQHISLWLVRQQKQISKCIVCCLRMDGGSNKQYILISAFVGDGMEVMRDGGCGHWLVRMEWRPAGWSVCLPLLVFPCTIKSRSSLLAPAHPGGPRKTAVKRLWCGGGAVASATVWRGNVSNFRVSTCGRLAVLARTVVRGFSWNLGRRHRLRPEKTRLTFGRSGLGLAQVLLASNETRWSYTFALMSAR